MISNKQILKAVKKSNKFKLLNDLNYLVENKQSANLFIFEKIEKCDERFTLIVI